MQCLCTDCQAGAQTFTDMCFKDLWLFDHFSEDQMQELKKIGQKRTIAKGAPIFRQGDTAKKMFLIKAGRIKLSKVSENGAEVTLDFRKAGDVIGEDMFSSEDCYPVSAWALEETTTCGFSLQKFAALVLANPEIGLNVIRSMSKKISSMTGRLESIRETSLEQRLYSVLGGIAKEHGQPAGGGVALPFRLTHEDLAFLVGAHRVSVTKAMQSLAASGKIASHEKIITLKHAFS